MMAKHVPKGVSTGEELNVVRHSGKYQGRHRIEDMEIRVEMGMIDSYFVPLLPDGTFAKP